MTTSDMRKSYCSQCQNEEVLPVSANEEIYIMNFGCIQDVDPGDVLINMNEAGDDHVSFSARHLALSPDGRWAGRGARLVL